MTTAILLLVLAADPGWRPPAEHPFPFVGAEAAIPLRVEVAPDVLENLRVTVTLGERSLHHRIPRLR